MTEGEVGLPQKEAGGSRNLTEEERKFFSERTDRCLGGLASSVSDAIARESGYLRRIGTHTSAIRARGHVGGFEGEAVGRIGNDLETIERLENRDDQGLGRDWRGYEHDIRDLLHELTEDDQTQEQLYRMGVNAKERTANFMGLVGRDLENMPESIRNLHSTLVRAVDGFGAQPHDQRAQEVRRQIKTLFQLLHTTEAKKLSDMSYNSISNNVFHLTFLIDEIITVRTK